LKNDNSSTTSDRVAVREIRWDIDSPFSSNRGELLPVGSDGHTGFTGTSLWIDPTTKTYIVLLTNAVHPRGRVR
jgi:CubicO group peptidase (beta-lactamase class C family)